MGRKQFEIENRKHMKVLITCGPTWMPIDHVRVISNTSTGAMGHAMAQAFIDRGASVTLLEGPVLDRWQHPQVSVVKYTFFDQLERHLKILLKKRFDIIIHAAAVSDFKVGNNNKGKLSSDKQISLTLIPTKKLITQIRTLSPKSILVGFKLESTITEAVSQAQMSMKSSGMDFAVANCYGKKYIACLLNKKGDVIYKTSQKLSLAKFLVDAIKDYKQSLLMQQEELKKKSGFSSIR